MVTVAMSAMMATRKTMLKVTTMTTVLHRVWRLVKFSLYNLFVFRVFFGLHGVAASSLIVLYDRVLVSVLSFFFRSRNVILFFTCFSVKKK